MKPLLMLISLLSVQPCRADISPQSMAFNCRNCHQPSSAKPDVPSLEKLTAEDMRRLLLDFKYDKKPATLMPRIAKGYSDAELSAVADLLGRR